MDKSLVTPAVAVLEGALVLLRPRGNDLSESKALSFSISESSAELAIVVLEGFGALFEGAVRALGGTGRGGAASWNVVHPSLSPERGDDHAGMRGVAGQTAEGVQGGDPERNSSMGLAFSFSHAT
jgi:hypothetical protein